METQKHSEIILEFIAPLCENSSVENDVVQLSREQIMMLKMSDNDIKNGNVVNQNDLDKEDLIWLKTL